MSDYRKTHLCGSAYGSADKRCEYLLYASNGVEQIGKKKLQQYHVYCTSEGKVRTMGCMASWTGCSPKWCPKRKAMEEKE